MATLQRAIEIAVEAHASQKRRNGDPYVLHPIRVMLSVSSVKERIVAIMHDVVEDSTWSIEDLRKEGFSDDVLEAVEIITKEDGADYDQYVQSIADCSLARTLKMADLKDNMNILELPKVDAKANIRFEKYHQAYKYLAAVDD